MAAENEQVGFWGNVDPSVKKGLVIGVSVLLVGGTAFFVIRKANRKRRADKVLKNALHDGTLASIVEKIDVAIDGIGTDEEKVYEAFSDIPTFRQLATVAQMYKDAYGETLDEALRGDLGTDELQTVKNILAGKPKRKGEASNYDLLSDWQRRLKSASGIFDTDEDAIYRVLWEVPDLKGYGILSKAMVTNKEIGYGDLSSYLKAQLGDSELDHAKYIMQRKK